MQTNIFHSSADGAQLHQLPVSTYPRKETATVCRSRSGDLNPCYRPSFALSPTEGTHRAFNPGATHMALNLQRVDISRPSSAASAAAAAAPCTAVSMHSRALSSVSPGSYLRETVCSLPAHTCTHRTTRGNGPALPSGVQGCLCANSAQMRAYILSPRGSEGMAAHHCVTSGGGTAVLQKAEMQPFIMARWPGAELRP